MTAERKLIKYDSPRSFTLYTYYYNYRAPDFISTSLKQMKRTELFRRYTVGQAADVKFSTKWSPFVYKP